MDAVPIPARRGPTVDRSLDRRITVAAIGVSLAYLVAATIALLASADPRPGSWLPLHLALAGGASTAIAGVMPFFAAAFAAAPPTDPRIRAGAVAAVAGGALGVAVGVAGGHPAVGVAGGLVYAGGIALVAIATLAPSRRGLGPRGGLIRVAYLVALLEVAIGAMMAILLLAGWSPPVEAWARLKPAHAWLNLIGFLSLVIATTLLHFYPTVVGARILSRGSARLVVLGLAAGPPVVALGYVVTSDTLVRLGAILSLIGSLALAFYAWRTWQARAPWTTDGGWHRFAIGGLGSAIGWLQVGVLIAAGRVLVDGADPRSWSAEAIVAPLVVGWVGISIVASATHLIPAVGPGDHTAHRRQRELLGRAATLRLALISGGTAMLTIGLWQVGWMGGLGAVVAGIGFGLTIAALVIAMTSGRSSPASGPASAPRTPPVPPPA
jgi:nitrite reductase (NO-forming)